jgi:hypothetical protein
LRRPQTRSTRANDVEPAIDRLLGSRQHFSLAANLRHPAGWLRWRLSRWLNLDGTAKASPTRVARRAPIGTAPT